MKPLPCAADLLAVAARIIWFEPPEQALADSLRFLAYLMTYGTLEEIAVVRRYVDLDDFRDAVSTHRLGSLMNGRGLIGTWSSVTIRSRRCPAE
ncbi:MAG: hypothetical protein ACJ8F3_21745 [Xanthobacteraceae bacterium]